MAPIITLLTDFGNKDGYVAAMKGVALSVNPQLTFVDIAHEIPPQDVFAGAFILGVTHDVFPRDTIHLAVVDPGVGTERPAILLETPQGLFVGPDNGLFTLVLAAFQQKPLAVARSLPPTLVRSTVPPPVKAYLLENSALFRTPVSHTFHGRDVFTPVAAELSMGLLPAKVGREVDTVTVFALPPLYRPSEGVVEGHVIHVDSFGNLITNIKAADIPEGDVEVTVADRIMAGFTTTYGMGSGIIALVGSSGYLEIAARDGNAAQSLHVGRWIPVRVRATSKG